MARLWDINLTRNKGLEEEEIITWIMNGYFYGDIRFLYIKRKLRPQIFTFNTLFGKISKDIIGE